LPSFKIRAPWPLSEDQRKAVRALVEGVRRGYRFQTLLGVTGSGKTYTMAHVIAALQRPALVLAHNKTLAAQLYSEFKDFFPENEVHYFVSYYDYYQPEAYVPERDIYIEKDASVNERLEKLRLDATRALLERRDVVVVSSVSCIYGIGKRENYEEAILRLSVGDPIGRRDLFERLFNLYYERNDVDFAPGTFRSRGEVVDVFPPYSEVAYRLVLGEDALEEIFEIEPLSGRRRASLGALSIYPAKHYVTDRDAIKRALALIEMELSERLSELRSQGKFVEAQRLEARTRYDMEMLDQVGYCSGIENYSRHLEGRRPGEPPGVLLDFFPEDFLMFIDESHITVPQVRGMYNGDISRKRTLVEYGFRLPSCMDNRPLKWEEFERYMRSCIFVSATPGDYELSVSSQVVEQIIRPTGVVDPELEVYPASEQVDHLVGRLKEVVHRGDRAIVTTLTKRMAEDLAEYLAELGFRVRYIHSDIDAVERATLLRDLRVGEFDVLVGINLLREGIDLPEVSLVAILDADKTGFLRSHRSLIQMIGRAARNVRGKVIMYADQITDAIREAIRETSRRRRIQMEYNERHGIVPRSVTKEVKYLLPEEISAKVVSSPAAEVEELDLEELERRMWEHVERLEFERAAEIRDLIRRIRERTGRPSWS